MTLPDANTSWRLAAASSRRICPARTPGLNVRLLLCACCTVAAWTWPGIGRSVAADAWAAAAADRPHEGADPLASWGWYHEVTLSEADQSPWVDFLLPPAVFAKARADLGDLRLYDAQGREVPFVLRVRRTHEVESLLPAREFGRRQNADGSAEVSLDLGEKPREHQRLDVDTRGDDFCRRVQVRGSDDGQRWTVLQDGDCYINRYPIETQVVDTRKVPYPPSRCRYLSVRVLPDPDQAGDKPLVSSVSAYHVVALPGEYVTAPAVLGPRQAVQGEEGLESAWDIELAAQAVPCERLTFEVAGDNFIRTFRLEKVDSEAVRWVIIRSEWRRTAGDRKPLEVKFEERPVRRLRLVVADHNNPPLNVTAVRYTAAARQVVFARSDDLVAPLRLYVGNNKAEAPRYDLAAKLGEVLDPAPARASLGDQKKNLPRDDPADTAGARPSWLVYVMLGTAGVAVLAMAGLLLRRAMARRAAHAGK